MFVASRKWSRGGDRLGVHVLALQYSSGWIRLIFSPVTRFILVPVQIGLASCVWPLSPHSVDEVGDVVLKGTGLLTGAFSVCVCAAAAPGITSTHTLSAFFLVLLLMLQIFCLLIFRRQIQQQNKCRSFFFGRKIQDPSRVISITLETLVGSYQRKFVPTKHILCTQNIK